MELSYSVVGEGPVLVLFHGVTHRRHAWDPVLPYLTPQRRCVLVDLPGHGASPDLPDGADAIEATVAALRELLDVLTADGEPIHLAGNSLGGWLALELACRGGIASVTALSPAGFFLAPWDQRRVVRQFLALRAIGRRLLPLRGRLVRHAVGRTMLMAAFAARPWRAAPAALAIDMVGISENTVIDRGLTADLTFTTPVDPGMPITIGWGTRDVTLPIYEAREVRWVFPHARVVRMRGLGHVPMADDPRAVAALLLEGSRGPEPGR